jgi:hypothetical protein
MFTRSSEARTAQSGCEVPRTLSTRREGWCAGSCDVPGVARSALTLRVCMALDILGADNARVSDEEAAGCGGV